VPEAVGLAATLHREVGLGFLVVGIGMIVFAWPGASWGLSVYWGKMERAGRVKRDERR
jgi:hypothetical protein